MQKKPSRETTKLTIFTGSRDEWDTKKGTIIPEECIASTAVRQKAPLRMKQCRTVKKSSP